ncbi:MAG: S-layer homology domain-containing protein, partial [Demequina sp.]|uniref:S-layer homology domain-containing protein n=1 Tax=Demequina sp. TaxID=2050685 RepID=UPI003A8BA4F2
MKRRSTVRAARAAALVAVGAMALGCLAAAPAAASVTPEPVVTPTVVTPTVETPAAEPSDVATTAPPSPRPTSSPKPTGSTPAPSPTPTDAAPDPQPSPSATAEPTPVTPSVTPSVTAEPAPPDPAPSMPQPEDPPAQESPDAPQQGTATGSWSAPPAALTPRLTFSDVSSVKGSAGYTPYATAIEWLAAQGATFGWGLAERSATFDAHDPATRADLAAFLFRAAGPPVHVPPEESPYEDVAPTDDAYAAITWLSARGVVLAGPAQAFDPAANVSIADAAVAIRRLADEPRVILVQGLTFTPQKEPTALQDALVWLDDRHLLGTTAPSAREARDTALSRGALAQLLYEVHEAGVGLSTTPTLAERWAERTDLAGTLEGMRNGLLPATALCPLPWDVTEALACPAA